MSAEIIIAGLSLLGTLAGTAGGIIVSGKLVNYRIEQLEKKVEKHNNLITRTFRLEQAWLTTASVIWKRRKSSELEGAA